MSYLINNFLSKDEMVDDSDYHNGGHTVAHIFAPMLVLFEN
jgi:hypothetical protein